MPVHSAALRHREERFALRVVECLPKLTLEKPAAGDAIEVHPRKDIVRRRRYWELPGAEVGGDDRAVQVRDYRWMEQINRSPFLDSALWDYVTRLPAGLRLRGDVLKAMLRKMAARHISERVISGGKRGFNVPAGRG